MSKVEKFLELLKESCPFVSDKETNGFKEAVEEVVLEVLAKDFDRFYEQKIEKGQKFFND